MNIYLFIAYEEPFIFTKLISWGEFALVVLNLHKPKSYALRRFPGHIREAFEDSEDVFET